MVSILLKRSGFSGKLMKWVEEKLCPTNGKKLGDTATFVGNSYWGCFNTVIGILIGTFLYGFHQFYRFPGWNEFIALFGNNRFYLSGLRWD